MEIPEVGSAVPAPSPPEAWDTLRILVATGQVWNVTLPPDEIARILASYDAGGPLVFRETTLSRGRGEARVAHDHVLHLIWMSAFDLQYSDSLDAKDQAEAQRTAEVRQRLVGVPGRR